MTDSYYIRVRRRVPASVTRNRHKKDGTLVAPYTVKAYEQPACVIPDRRTWKFCPTCSGWPKHWRLYCSGCGGREKVPYTDMEQQHARSTDPEI